MKLGIRFKLLAILLLAAVLPLVLGVLSLQIFGNRYYQANQGRLFQSAANQLAHTLSFATNTQIEKISDWIVLSNCAQRTRTLAPTTNLPPAEIERRWPRLSASDAPLRAILENELSQELRRFRALNPLFREIFVTDARGLLVASTNKTSNYDQSGEAWWRKAGTLPPRVAWLEGISYDNSAKIHSLNVAFNLRGNSGGASVGVVKGVLNASSLFAHLPRETFSNGAQREVVLGDGRILARLFDSTYAPLSNRYENFAPLIEDERGWQITVLETRDKNTGVQSASELIGIAPLSFEGVGVDRVAVAGLSPMFVVVRDDESRIFAPISRQLLLLSLGGGVLLLAFSVAGLWIAERKIIAPLRVLGKAARSMAHTAQLEDDAVVDKEKQTLARQAVQHCRAINTNDEISALADDFAVMGERVLRYHSQLEKEIAEKTGEIQRDLEMAREFQEALLPREYPHLMELADEGDPPTLNLSFHHVYKPTLSVGGDFFDVFKLSDHEAGIFVADVMGHGARSALVSAILRTLLQDVATQTNDPAELLRLINRHFYSAVQGSGQFVFVSAFCLILDTQSRTATYANAGHPSPLFAEGATARVLPLLGYGGVEGTHNNAALGLAADSTYERYSRAVAPGDAFLLYTDGVVEAPNAAGDEFGMAQLENVVAREIARHPEKLEVAELCHAVMNSVTEWMQGIPSPDDICLVVVGADGEPILA